MPDVSETTETVDVEETSEVAEVEETPLGPDAEADQSLGIQETGDGIEVLDTPDSMHVEEEESADEVDDEVFLEEAADEALEVAEAEAPVEPAPEAVEEPAVEESGETDGEPIAPPPASPYDMPGDWYVIHSYSGYENKVKANLETRIQSMHMEDRIFEVHIPMEDVVEFKGGKKVTVPKKVFPGYILVRMTLDDDSWYAVRNTPGVTGFVAGNAQKPTPLSRREVERFLGVQEEEEKGKPRFKPEWDVGEQVRVVTGPFADFNGVIEELNVDQQKVVVLVNIFGRDTPVELGFEDIQKS
jgi:transcription termination/antitermination protein NusG